MNKFKVVKSAGLTRLVIKSIKGQQINEHELYAINCNKVPGLLHLDLHKKKDSFKMSYDITGFVSLRKYLKKPLNKESFGIMLLSIMNTLKGMTNSYFNLQCVYYDYGCVMINESTRTAYLVYVPALPFESPYTLRDFLLGIIERCTFVSNEDNSYVREYIEILNSGIHFSVFELEQYVNGLFGPQMHDEGCVECYKCHQMVPANAHYCSCGAKLSGFSGDIGWYDPNKPGGTGGEFTPPMPVDEERYQEEKGDEGTCVLSEETGGTTVLGTTDLSKKQRAFLVWEKTGETIKINKNEFVIGKSVNGCDYTIRDNSAVSRNHLKIICKDERYYAFDMKSTNKTYVDGKAIPPEENFEIFAGNKLKLANEDFTFKVEV